MQKNDSNLVYLEYLKIWKMGKTENPLFCYVDLFYLSTNYYTFCYITIFEHIYEWRSL